MHEAAEVLARAAEAGQRVSIERAGGEVVISTKRLDQVLEHEAGDLTAIVEAGVRVRDLNAQLADHGQMFALDPPGNPTIGACIAANLSGPRRHRYGTARDLVIGITVVLADGTIASSGGKVVKNVAGYDLGKVFCGSEGRFGLIARAALRLYPRPEVARTLAVPVESPVDAVTRVRAILRGPFTPSAVDIVWPGWLALIPALNGLGWHSLNEASLNTNLVIALITLVVITVLNIYGVKLVSIINNTGVVFEVLGMFVFALVLMAFHNHQGFSVVTNSAGIPVNGSTFLAAMFMSLFVIYGFDTAATLSEETKDPRRAAPKAVLYSVIGAFIIGGVFLLGVLVAIPNMGEAVKGAFGPAAIIEANFSTPFATIYLLVVSAAIFVCCLSIMAATIRLCLGMARENQLPGSSFLAKVSPNLHTPVWAASRWRASPRSRSGSTPAPGSSRSPRPA